MPSPYVLTVFMLCVDKTAQWEGERSMAGCLMYRASVYVPE